MWPSRRHSSSAMCGASGATSSTSCSATDARHRAARLGQVVVQLGDLGDGGVEAQPVQVLARRRRSPCAGRAGSPRRASASTTVTSPVASSTMLRHSRCSSRYWPTTARVSHGPRDVQRAHRHLVQAQRVGAVLGADLVRSDRVLQRLAHLAQQPGDLLALVVVAAVALLHLGGRHRDAARVAVDERLDHALVEQLVERLRRTRRAPGRTAPWTRSARTAGAARRARRRPRTGRRRRAAGPRAGPSSTARCPGRPACSLLCGSR